MDTVLLFLLLLISIIFLHGGFLKYRETFAEQQCVDPVSGQVRTETVSGTAYVSGTQTVASGSTTPTTFGSATGVPVNKAPEEEVAPNRVFYIKNGYKHSEAKEVCSLYGAQVATKDNLVGAYKRGANWCSWGWLADGSVAYPVQKDFWRKVEKQHKGFCGPNYGINMKKGVDSELEFGVLCYGVPPAGYRDPRHTFKKPKHTIQRRQDECIERKERQERSKWEREQRWRNTYIDNTIPIL
jgi:hypothetical protein